MNVDEWEIISPTVNAEAEFFEILNDFGNPLELLREGISNAIDAGATTLCIEFSVETIEGVKRTVIRLRDNGSGMTMQLLKKDFWGLGYSPSRDRSDAIGEKGHGTKIYLRSEKVTVRTQSDEGACEADCEKPMSKLADGKLHQPRVRSIDKYQNETGTEITIIGYNDNERSKFVQDIVKDYILWFTKIGSVEKIFGIDKYNDFKVTLKCLDQNEPEELSFGHLFPDENSDINKLFDKEGPSAAGHYVKQYKWSNRRLHNHPEVKYDAVIYVEGDAAKRKYNPMLRERLRPNSGQYRVGDRYGMYLCKDYIPIVRVNDWVTGFGTGSNAVVQLHGFINCQSLKLTANRGTIANTDPQILAELQDAVKELLDEVDAESNKNGLYILKDWQDEQRTVNQEGTEYNRRKISAKTRSTADYNGSLLLEPRNESELFGLFMIIHTLHPELFKFQPLDYNTTRGIDIFARSKIPSSNITDGEYWYVELKYLLKLNFNHTFKHLRWILCWDFDSSVSSETEFLGVEENDVRRLETDTDNGQNIYYLNSKKSGIKIQVLKLKELLKVKLGIEFDVLPTKGH